MSLEFDIACLRAPCEPCDTTSVVQLIARAKMAADQLEELTAQRDSLLSALRALYGWQRAEVEHFGANIPDDFIIEMVEKAIKNA